MLAHHDRFLKGIGEVSTEYGISHRTLRFYEDRGLIEPMREGSLRSYGPKDEARITLILKGKKLGFSLAEIKSMISSPKSARAPTELALKPEQITRQIESLERKRDDVNEAIVALRQVLKVVDA